MRAQHPGGQVVVPDLDRHRVGAQLPDRRVVVLDEQAEEQVLGAEVVLVAALGLLGAR